MARRGLLRAAGRAAWLAAGLTIAACAGWEDYDPPLHTDIKEGRGMLSGEDGEFAVELDVDRGDEANGEEAEKGEAEESTATE